MKILALTALLAAAVAVDPLTIPWQPAVATACVIAALGAFFDHAADSGKWAKRSWTNVLATIGLSSITAAAAFSLTRRQFTDSLQATVLAGICGIYGRRYLQKIADRAMKKVFGYDPEADRRDPKSE